nr:8216_t:CDS:2 [Entrophospora candida]CAG8506587.1 14994_t:CDS:2 [Entrophospora candida]
MSQINSTPTICILGCGTMGQAILSGVLKSLSNDTTIIAASSSSTITTTFNPNKFIACVSNEESAKKLSKSLNNENVSVLSDKNVKGVSEADVIIMCTKPQIAKKVLTEKGMFGALENKLLISILAGVPMIQLKEWVPTSTRVIRAMPNTPCMIQEGMTVLSCHSDINPNDKDLALWIFQTLGRVRFLDEKHLDAVTGLSGSGPAFVCVVLEALADGGVMMGLPRDVAVELAAQGAARLVLQTRKHPAAVKDEVTTPAGCTIAGLLTMEDGKIRSTIARAVQEATVVASSLGKAQEKKI